MPANDSVRVVEERRRMTKQNVDEISIRYQSHKRRTSLLEMEQSADERNIAVT